MLCLLACLLSVCLAEMPCHLNERSSLEMLYWTTSGSGWLQKWDVLNIRSDPCLNKWFGIQCDPEGYVIKIELSSNYLVGALPKYFARFKRLQVIDLSANYLSGSIPANFGTLSTLRYAALSQNQFIGNVPETLANLPFLKDLRLDGNTFDAPLPTSVLNLPATQSTNLVYDAYMDS